MMCMTLLLQCECASNELGTVRTKSIRTVDDVARPELFFEVQVRNGYSGGLSGWDANSCGYYAYSGGLIASRFLQVPEDSVFWDTKIRCLDIHGNLVGQRVSDNRVTRISPEGKYRNDLLAPIDSTLPTWDFFGIDSLDRFWDFHFMHQEKDDAKQVAGTYFVLYDENGTVLKEIHPKWRLIPNNLDPWYIGHRRSVDSLLNSGDQAQIPLMEFYGDVSPSMHFNSRIEIWNFKWGMYVLDLEGRLQSYSERCYFDVYGNRYFSDMMLANGDRTFIREPSDADKDTCHFILPSFRPDNNLDSSEPGVIWMGTNRNGLICFMPIGNDLEDQRWGTNILEFAIVDGKDGRLISHKVLRWNADKLKKSMINQILLNDSNELLLFTTEYEPILKWRKEYYYPSNFWIDTSWHECDSYGQRTKEEVWLPEGGKNYFRIYKLSIE